MTGIDGQAAAPIGRISPVDDTLAGRHAIDKVWTAADGRFEIGSSEIALAVDVFRDNGHQAENERNFPVAIRREMKFHGMGAEALDAFHLGVIGLVVGTPLVAERFQRKNDIIDRHGPAVREAGRRIQGKRNPASVCRHLNPLGQQTVEREGLVITTGEEAFKDVLAQAQRRCTPYNERVEAIE